ncbi:glycosyl transferase family 1 [Chloroflexus islandicus]|uniref:Glycosyl transferase family 1 n=1 Tax=Chloroflexus islandicus TaxID=1707952 RepID=A0A178MD55_9CHLR|nr:glycosyltransferase family 4 protein [Chloroflexus islandicus]OAN46473.1 glycosyl transferase family 1 [Chloroflexus islandicus]
MHILQISWEYPPHIVGGLGRHVADLAPALIDHEVTVTVMTPQLRGGETFERQHNLTICRVAIPPFDTDDFPSFVRHAGRHLEHAAHALFPGGRPDLIHVHDWLTAEVGIALKHHWRVPLIATIHATERGRGRGDLNGHQSQQINDLEWRLTYEAWRVIVCSHFMARQIREYFATPPDKIDVISNGVHIPPQPFATPADWVAFRRRFAADNEALVIFVGRLVYEKGVHILLEAWPRVVAELPARLVIAGAGSASDDLRLRAAELGVSVEFLGFISDEDRNRLYAVGDVAVFPSLYEPFGIVALEAFAAGCPVIVSDAGGLAEVVQHELNGLVVPAGDAVALANALLASLHAPAESRLRAARGAALARAYYTWNRIAGEVKAVYDRVWTEWKAGAWGKEIMRRA